MIGLNVLLKRVGLLVVRLRKDDQPIVDYLEGVCREGNVTIRKEERDVEPELFFKKIPNYPVVVLFTGEGIITKVFDEEGAGMERITAGEEFLWDREATPEGGVKIVFTRKEKLATWMGMLEKRKVPVMRIYLNSLVEERELEQYIYCFFQQELKWKILAEPTPRGNWLCTLLLRRSKLAVLVILLCLLMINYVWSGILREHHASIQFELTRLERNVSARDKHSREVERVVSEYRRTGNRRNALIVDRVAAVTPPEIVLESLEVSPLLKLYEEGKPLSVRDGLLRCKGRSAMTEEVTRFIDGLVKAEFAKEVKLVSLEQERETGQSVFKIEIRL